MFIRFSLSIKGSNEFNNVQPHVSRIVSCIHKHADIIQPASSRTGIKAYTPRFHIYFGGMKLPQILATPIHLTNLKTKNMIYHYLHLHRYNCSGRFTSIYSLKVTFCEVISTSRYVNYEIKPSHIAGSGTELLFWKLFISNRLPFTSYQR